MTRPLPVPELPGLPVLGVVVPAHDEQDLLDGCLEALAREVALAVNDSLGLPGGAAGEGDEGRLGGLELGWRSGLGVKQ